MQHKLTTAALTASLCFPGAAQAVLIDRGGGLIYDDVLNITWLKDANSAPPCSAGVLAGSFV